MSLRRVSAVLASLVLACLCGCTALPEYKEDPLTTAEIVRHVRCELKEALRVPENRWLTEQRWNVKLSFTFDLQQISDLSAGDSSWLYPFHAPGTFTASIGGGASGTSNRTENLEFDQSLQFLLIDNTLHCPPPGGHERRLGGEIGVGDLLERSAYARNITVSQSNTLTKLAYTVEFVIKKNINLTPRFNVIPLGGGRTYSGGMKWTGSRNDSQKLILTFSPPSGGKSDECSVVAADGLPWPDPRKCPIAVYTVDVQAACHILNKGACAARSDCAWTEKSTCAPKALPRGIAMGRRSGTPAAVAAPGVPTGAGVSQSDKAVLDSGASRSVLDDISNQLRRQGIGN